MDPYEEKLGRLRNTLMDLMVHDRADWIRWNALTQATYNEAMEQLTDLAEDETVQALLGVSEALDEAVYVEVTR